MKDRIIKKTANLFILIVLGALFANSVVMMFFSADLKALMYLIFHICIAFLYFRKSRFLSIALMVWGSLIIVAGLYKIVLQSLASTEELFSDPYHLIKLGLILIGFLVYTIGSRELLTKKSVPVNQDELRD